MKHKLNLSFGLLLVAIAGRAQPSESEPGYTMANKLRDNVVAILTKKDGEPKETGFGFIVAMNNQKASIVTANHVVKGGDSIIVNYRGYETKPYIAEYVSLNNTNGVDIAMLKVDAPENFVWVRNCYSEISDPNTRTFYVGRSGDWYVPTGSAAGSINEVTPDKLVLDMRAYPGTSGAPLINHSGIIGLITRDDFKSSEAIHISLVKHILKNVHRQPFELEVSFGPGVNSGELSLPKMITNLKNAATEAEAMEALTQLREEFNDPIHTQADLRKSRDRFAEAVVYRLKSTTSEVEINNVFDAMEEYASRDTLLGNDLAISLNGVLEDEYIIHNSYLGDLLLEGYKKTLINHNGNLKNNFSETREIYQFISMVSDHTTIERNVLLSQVQLLNDGVLECNARFIKYSLQGGVMKNKAMIPEACLNIRFRDIVKRSALQGEPMTNASDAFIKRRKAIKLFDQKLQRFRSAWFVVRMSHRRTMFYDNDLIRNNRCNQCELFNFVFDNRLLN